MWLCSSRTIRPGPTVRNGVLVVSESSPSIQRRATMRTQRDSGWASSITPASGMRTCRSNQWTRCVHIQFVLHNCVPFACSCPSPINLCRPLPASSCQSARLTAIMATVPACSIFQRNEMAAIRRIEQEAAAAGFDADFEADIAAVCQLLACSFPSLVNLSYAVDQN